MMAGAMPLREIRLYGELGRRFGRVFRLAVQSPAEAIRALCAVLPGFRSAFVGQDGLAEYFVFVGKGQQRSRIAEASKDDLVGADAPIRFVPVVAGAKRQGLGQTIMGAVLVVAGVALAILSEGAAIAPADAMIKTGAAMIIGGVVTMLSPQRSTVPKQTENDPSYGMDAGAVNSSDAGPPVPLCYGRMIVGSVRISGGLTTDDILPTSGGGLGGAQELPDYMPEAVVDSGAVAGRIWGDHGS